MTAVAIADQPVPTIQWNNLWWVAGSVVITVVAVQSHDFWLLNFVHVLSGLMWTGIDLFMGFVIGARPAQPRPRRPARFHHAPDAAHAVHHADAGRRRLDRGLVSRRPARLSRSAVSGAVVGSSPRC